MRNQVKRAKAADGASIRFDLQFVILLILLLGAGSARAELSVKYIDINSFVWAKAWDGDPYHVSYPALFSQSRSTNFGTIATNLNCSMGWAGANAYADSYLRLEVEPLWIGAQTDIYTGASAATNGSLGAQSGGDSSFYLRFELSLPHSYTVSNSLSSWLVTGSAWGQILLTDDLNQQYYLSNLTAGAGLTVAQGLLPPGLYRLSAVLRLGQLPAPPSGYSSASLVVQANLTPLFPQLSIVQNGTNNILAWHTNFVGFQLQSNSDALFNSWNDVGRTVVVVGDQHTVTVPIAVASGYYRLFKP